jgi:predicted extracellular nuclease
MMVCPIWEHMNIMSKYLFFQTILLFWLNSFSAIYQNDSTLYEGKRGDIRIMFYNVENFFDTRNDSLTADDEFLPGSDKDWNNYRFKEKTIHLFKTIAAVGETFPPEIICFAEIENKKVLFELVKNTPLEKYEYEIVHYDSPDFRGIDVGLIYRKDVLKKICSQQLPISFPFDPSRTTRDILYLKALTENSDTIHLFVNHWPSRRGGQNISEPYRIHVAKILKAKTDSILMINPCANIIITGDFNDQPYDKSLTQSLSADTPDEPYLCATLYNLSAHLLETCKCGTYRYQMNWNMLDQFIVSGNLLHFGSGLKTCSECLHIARFSFLLLEDKKYGGDKPYRTYQGPIYKGGFSDHLPIYLDVYY